MCAWGLAEFVHDGIDKALKECYRLFTACSAEEVEGRSLGDERWGSVGAPPCGKSCGAVYLQYSRARHWGAYTGGNTCSAPEIGRKAMYCTTGVYSTVLYRAVSDVSVIAGCTLGHN